MKHYINTKHISNEMGDIYYTDYACCNHCGIHLQIKREW